jgi:hypothetical protein
VKKLPRQLRTSIFWRHSPECREASEHQPSEVWLSPTGSINLGFITEGNLLLCSSYLPLGVPNWVPNTHHQAFFWRRFWGERRFLQGESLTLNLLLRYCFALLYFFLHRFIKNTQKLVPFIVCILLLLLLVHYVVQ